MDDVAFKWKKHFVLCEWGDKCLKIWGFDMSSTIENKNKLYEWNKYLVFFYSIDLHSYGE